MNDMPTDQRLREKVEEIVHQNHAKRYNTAGGTVQEINDELRDAILHLIHAQQKEAVEACVRAVESGSYNQDGTCRSCYKNDNIWIDGTSACEGADVMRNIRTAAAGYLGEKCLEYNKNCECGPCTYERAGAPIL